MSKKRITVTLDEGLVTWLDSEYHNRSAAIQELVEAARDGTGAPKDKVREYQIQQLELDLKREQSQIQATKERLETLRSLQQQSESQTESELEDARDALEGVPREADNPAVVNWAGNLDMTPSELLEEL